MATLPVVTDFSHLTLEEVGYLAGIIDGEGCIRISNDKGYFYASLAVQMTNQSTINFLWKLYGGQYCERSKQCGNRRKIFEWKLFGSRFLPLLTFIEPYLHVKKRQAEVALALFSLDTKARGENKDDQRIYYEQMRQLNRTGMNS